MLLWKTKRPRQFDTGTDTLHRLLDRELHLASELAAATAEAERLVREAREYAIQAEASCETTINERVGSFSAANETELLAELQRIQSDAALEVARFNESDSTRTQSFVALLLEAIGAVSPTMREVG